MSKSLSGIALLSKLLANVKTVCLVIVDYAGLSTNPDDIRTWVK